MSTSRLLMALWAAVLVVVCAAPPAAAGVRPAFARRLHPSRPAASPAQPASAPPAQPASAPPAQPASAPEARGSAPLPRGSVAPSASVSPKRSSGQLPGPRRVLLERVQAVGVAPELARNLESALLAELGGREGITPISPAELEQIMAFEKEKAELGCDDLDRCLGELARRADADQVVTAKLGLLGSQLALALGLVDIAEQRNVRRVAAQGDDYAALTRDLGGLVDELLDGARKAPQFRLARGAALRLAVMPLTPLGVPASTADSMTQILATEYGAVSGLTVLGQDDVVALLRQIEKEAELGCTDNLQCVAEIGAALGLSKLVAGSVGKVGDTYVVALKLIDTRRVEVLSRSIESFAADSLELRHAVKQAAYDLLGIDRAAARGGLDITLNVDSGDARLGERAFSFRDHRFTLGGLPPGRYPLAITPRDASYLPWSSDIYVPAGANNVRSLALSRAPPRWYEHWWVWAIAGSVLTAGAASAVLLNRDVPDASGQLTVLDSR